MNSKKTVVVSMFVILAIAAAGMLFDEISPGEFFIGFSIISAGNLISVSINEKNAKK